MAAYYNEIDPYAAQWLRNLIDAGHIAPGIVDERSIEDVLPDELRSFTQCHFFAGVGVWSYALRRAGWPDERPVWTGSCPCQPFSAAGAGAGLDDKRHLWPHFHWLIQECRPATVIGEQVASKDAEPWLDLVQADMEAMGYAFGAVAFPAASVGAPHIRDRLYWVGNASGQRWEWRQGAAKRCEHDGANAGWLESHDGIVGVGKVGAIGLADTPSHRWAGGGQSAEAKEGWQARPDGGRELPQRSEGCSISSWEHAAGVAESRIAAPSPTNGFWRDADWLLCRDGKWRPVEPGTFPLAHGAPARVGRLRAYGNAICAPQAQLFIEAVMSCTP